MNHFPPLIDSYQSGTPKGYSDLDLFEHCVKFAAYKKMDLSPRTHLEWANVFFPRESTETRKLKMSRVKNKYGMYFTKGFKYTFEIDLIVKNFSQWFEGNNVITVPAAPAEVQLLLNTIEAIQQEVRQSQQPRNRESYQVEDFNPLQGNPHNGKYIYIAKIHVREDETPHFREGLQVTFKNSYTSFYGEVIEYDAVDGYLYFTTERSIPRGFDNAYVHIDRSFILIGLQQRIINYAQQGLSVDLPAYKFFANRTEQLTRIDHIAIPEYISASLKNDESQLKAFNAALDHDITFIWGPPGTGKSFTLAAIIRALYHIEDERTIVCCVSNVAVDQLVNKVIDSLEKDNVAVEPGNFYRAGRSTDDRINDTDYLFPKNDTIKKDRDTIKKHTVAIEVMSRRNSKSDTAEIIKLKAEIKDLRTKIQEQTDYLVGRSRVVFSTIANFILSDKINQSHFDNLIVDEASMLAMPQLIALAGKVAKRIILVGDFQQLSPIALVPNELLTDNVFKRCGIDIEHTNHPALHLLLNQRRSNEKIVNLINDTFYNKKLQAKVSEVSEIVNLSPYPQRVITSVSVEEAKVRFTKGGTRQNERSAHKVIDILEELKKTIPAKVSVGIITPYTGQANLLRALFAQQQFGDNFVQQVKIGTVHTFQGSECDIIIFDVVDCEKTDKGRDARAGKIYEMADGEQLLNVAVSRARHKLIIVGDVKWLADYSKGNVSAKTRSIMRKLRNYDVNNVVPQPEPEPEPQPKPAPERLKPQPVSINPKPKPQPQPVPTHTPANELDLKSKILNYLHNHPGAKASEMAIALFNDVERKSEINSRLYKPDMLDLWERDGSRGGYYLSMAGQQQWAKLQ